VKTKTTWKSWPGLQFQYKPTDRPHILEAAGQTLKFYKDGEAAIGHNFPPRGGKTGLAHDLAVELKAAGAPFVHILAPWNNLASQVVSEKRVIDNCKRFGFKGWKGKFVAHEISAIQSSRYWQRLDENRNPRDEQWTLISSTIHLVHSNRAVVEEAVRLAVDEYGARPVFIMDETHLLPEMQEWSNTLVSLQAQGAFIVTMTGTATRTDGACILGFRNIPIDDWTTAKEVAVKKMGEIYVRDGDGALVRKIDQEVRWGQERLVKTEATGKTVDWQTAFHNGWLHPISAEPVDFMVSVQGGVSKLSELDLKTAERGRSDWLKSSECCRALARKAVLELESWRSDSLTRHTKMLVVTTQDKDYAGGSGEKSANVHAREMRRQICEAVEASPVLSPQGLTIEICTSLTNNGEPDASAKLKLYRFGLTAPDKDGNEPIDILIVKTMGIVGLDVPECKIQIDASSIRRGPMKKQLATRILTQWVLADGSILKREGVCVYPCDPRNHAFYQGLAATSEQVKEKVWEDSLSESKVIEVKPQDAPPVIVPNSGQAAGYVNEGGKWLEGDYDALIARIRSRYPAASVLRKIDVIEVWKQGAFPGCDIEPQGVPLADTDADDDWENRIVNTSRKMQEVKSEETFGKKANRLASQVYKYSDEPEKWKKLVATLQSRAKRACRISPDISVDRIQDYLTIESLKDALDKVFSEAASEVVCS